VFVVQAQVLGVFVKVRVLVTRLCLEGPVGQRGQGGIPCTHSPAVYLQLDMLNKLGW
jgi:hypothetical protein